MIILDVMTGALDWAMFAACWALKSCCIWGRGVVKPTGSNRLIGWRCLGRPRDLAGTEGWVFAGMEYCGLVLLDVDTWVLALWLADGRGLCAGILDLCLAASCRRGAAGCRRGAGRRGAGRDLVDDGRFWSLELGWGAGRSLKRWYYHAYQSLLFYFPLI